MIAFYCTWRYFPALGLRSWTMGVLGNVGANGRCWQSSSSGLGGSVIRGSDLYSYVSSVAPHGTGGRAEGFPVRCVQEFT